MLFRISKKSPFYFLLTWRLLLICIQGVQKKSTPFRRIFSVIPTKNSYKKGYFIPGHPHRNYWYFLFY